MAPEGPLRSLPHHKLDDTVRSIQCGFYCSRKIALLDLTTTEELNILAFELNINQNGDQVLAKRIHVIEVCHPALDAALDGFFNSQQSRRGSSPEPAGFIVVRSC
jgi:hypothetical protein